MRTKLTLPEFNSNPGCNHGFNRVTCSSSDGTKSPPCPRPYKVQLVIFQGCEFLTNVHPDIVSGHKLNILNYLTN